MRDAVSHADVLAAARRIRGQVLDTPFLQSRTLSEICRCDVWIKFENLQFTASFKERGALNRLLLLPPADRRRGVLAVSAGNHAQGVAYHAGRLGIAAVIVMPATTPLVKIQRTRDFGAEVVLHGESFDEAKDHGIALAEDRGLVFVHPYDDPAVIAGQGTIALEMLRGASRPDTIVVPVGGGGLVSGIAVAAKHLDPRVRIVGVETSAFPAAHAALAGQRARFRRTTIAEGIAVREMGRFTLPLMRRHVDEMLLVPETAIERAIVALLEIEKTVAEGAGAAPLAALLAHKARFAGRRVGLVLSGGNIDALVLAEIIRRDLARGRRLVRFTLRLPDRPGALARVSTLFAGLDANIDEIHHQRTFGAGSLRSPDVEFTVQTRGPAHTRAIERALEAAGFRAQRAHGGPPRA